MHRTRTEPDIPMKAYPTIDDNANEEFEEKEKEQLRDEIDVTNYTNTLARTVNIQLIF